MAARLGGSPTDWSIGEVGDGNLNLVFIVKGTKSGIAVKQALPYVRLVGESWPLPLSRSHYEHLALVHQARLAPGLVPSVLHHDENSRPHRHGAARTPHHHAQGTGFRHLLSPLRRRHHDLSGADLVLLVRPRHSRRAEEGRHCRIRRQPRAVQDHGRPCIHRALPHRRTEPLDVSPGSMRPPPPFARTSTCMSRSRGSSSNSWAIRKP